MSKLGEILKVLKQQQNNHKYTMGQLFNAIHPEWQGEVDAIHSFNEAIKGIELAGLVVTTQQPNVELVVRISESGLAVVDRFE